MPKSRYFHISSGCFMPDSVQTVKVSTRKELRQIIFDEAYYWRDAGCVGLSKRALAEFVARSWRDCGSPVVLPIREVAGKASTHRIFIQEATRAEWLENKED